MKRVWVLVLVGVLVYLPSLMNGFVWDDEEQIVNNGFIRSLANWPEVLGGSTFGGGGASLPTGGYYKPMMSLWYMVNYSLFGEWAGGFHLMQVLLHGVNGVLVYWLFAWAVNKIKMQNAKCKMTNQNLKFKKGVGDTYEGGESRLAFWVALIWVVHPVNVESVVYAASAQEVLYLFFGLLGLLLLIKRSELKMQEVNVMALSAGLMGLSLLSKEAGGVMMVLGVVYLWLVEGKKREGVMYGLLLSGVVGMYGLLRFGLAKVGVEENGIIPVAQLALGERLMTVVETLWQHVRVIAWPWRLNIGHHQVVTEVSGEWLMKLLIIVGLTAGWVVTWLRTKSGWVKFFLVWVLLGFGLVSNIYPLDMTFAERWGYGPMVGFLGVLLVSLKSKTQNSKIKITAQNAKYIINAIGVMVVLVMAIRSMLRVFEWRDGLTLYSRDIVHAQNAFDLENNLGVELFRVGRLEEAKVHFERSIALNPHWWTPYSNLGVYYERKGEEEKAMELYKQSIENGDYYLAYVNLATMMVKREEPEAEYWLEEALLRFPNNRQLLELKAYWDTRGKK